MDAKNKKTYQVLARKWRPQSFQTLVGQDSVCRTLQNALTQNRLYPVLIFTGPRGTGKTSTARIVAKTLRCGDKKDNNPCHKCEECLLIQEGKNLDVIEIDGASNNGVDAVRELRESVHYLPSQGKHKIYIIDEVHMLSNSAFNALLKTLEEPPEHVLFMMATTEAHKIPQTVMSRAQRLDFHLIGLSLIKDHLEKICKKEKLNLEEQALWLIAKQAQGSLRDAQSLLDQMVTFCGQTIKTQDIVNILGLTDSAVIFKCLQAIVARDEKQILEALKDIQTKGNEPKLILQELISGLRNLIVLKVNPDNKEQLIQASKQELELWKSLSDQSHYDDLHFLFDMLLKGEQELLFSSDSQMVLEVLLLRFCKAPRIEQVAPLFFQGEPDSNLAEPSSKKSSKVQTPQKSSKVQTPQAKKKDSKIMSQEASSHSEHLDSTKQSSNAKTIDKDLKNKAINPNAKASTTSTEAKTQSTASSDLGSADAKLKGQTQLDHFAFVQFLKTKSISLASLFEQLSFKNQKEQVFTYCMPDSFAYIKKKLENPKNYQIIEEALNEFFPSDQKYRIQFESTKEKFQSLKKQESLKKQKEIVQKVLKDSFTQEVKEVFGGPIAPQVKDHS